MITTLIILKLLVKFGVIKPGSYLHPDFVMVQSKKMLVWIKGRYISREIKPSLVLIGEK